MYHTKIFPCPPPVNFYLPLAEVAECAKGGLFLSYIYELTLKNRENDGWFPTGCWDWYDTLLITAYELRTIRKKLKDYKVLEEVKKGMPPKIYMRVNMDELRKMVYYRSSMRLPHES